MSRAAQAPGPLLVGKAALVTGAGAGIGRGIAEAFAAHGAAVAMVDVDPARLREGAAAVDEAAGATDAGGRALPLEADVRDAEAVERVVAATGAELGAVDVLVNNVGHFLPVTPFLESDDETWRALYEINLAHVFRVTRAVLPGMIDRAAGGSIINVSTVEAFRGIPHHPVYAACKAGVTQFSKSLALDVGGHGIRVNDIAPDVTRSEQLPYERWLTPDDEARIPTWVPLGRLGEPADAAGVALFLASDLGAFVTGTTIHCDGGTLAAGGWYRTTHGPRPWTNRPLDP
ncbi:MAG: glucose 1-dehydrogenase [Acidimicrobiales bacterium]